jgi:opacity protein-like surface antigen
MKTLRAVCVLYFCLHVSIGVRSQSGLIPRYELGLHIGTFIYQGDLTPNDYGAFNTMKPGFAITATRNLNSLYAIRFQLLRGSLKGDDSKYQNPDWRQQRNFKFKTPVTELSVQAVRNILSLRSNEAGIINFTPYLFAGISYSFLNIERDWSNFNYSHFAGEDAVLNGLNEDINHKLPNGVFSMPIGGGIRYGINQKLSFGLEGTYRIIGNDYLDGFSRAANPEMADHYHTLMVGMIYSFGKRNQYDCPKVRF